MRCRIRGIDAFLGYRKGEDGKPGYGLYDRALGAAYLNGLFEAIEKDMRK